MQGIDKEIASRTGIAEAEVMEILKAFRSTLEDALVSGDNVAFPRFGSFNVAKEDDKIINDLATGKKVLLPPAIHVEFRESESLRKQLGKE